MHFALAAACLVLCTVPALAQSQPESSGNTPATQHSTGTTVVPDNKGQQQPQGNTGPLETEGRSAPAHSPQGQTPPGMQAAPEGSSKTIVEPKK